MVRVRDVVETEWKGIDTLVVSAASVEGIQHIIDVANAAVKGNYVGPLVSAVTFIPLLASTSVSPSILLISTLAAVTPPPTRSLYASTKTASLMLYSVLAIEHPTITFTHFLPSSVEGDFGASAVDAKTVQQRGTMTPGLKRDVVARRCLRAVDAGERMVFMPAVMGRAAQIGTVLFPAVIEWLACRRYRFSAA
ncbi:hypothetical protein A0H81_03422 [Grifola frondosa]|uniref:Uncharacterized protein n=1 Tax=Grifola frondosa TaxID=5627 RepID=A0A1C7MJE2_GRIFR|nr:hypothetical protein A0H81_03422 [Grifola frondosa]